MQSVTVGARHRDEVQVVTTAAPNIVAVQLLSTSSDDGVTVGGNMALQFPEIQRVRVVCRVHCEGRIGLSQLREIQMQVENEARTSS